MEPRLLVGVGSFPDSVGSGVNGENELLMLLLSSIWLCIEMSKSCNGDGTGVFSELLKIIDSLSLFIAIGSFSTVASRIEKFGVAKFLSEDSFSSTIPSRVAYSVSPKVQVAGSEESETIFY